MGKRRDYGQLIPLTEEEMQRLMGRVRKSKNGCWLWTGAGYRGGYGRIGLRGRVWMVHRVVYEHFLRHVEEDEVIDHLCRKPRCCNPEHLEAVKDAVNILRGAIPRGRKHYLGKRTHCKHGHPLSGDNLVWEECRGRPRRVCRTCRNRRKRKRWRQRNHSKGRSERE